MLSMLQIQNLALIDQAEIEFERGLNILSGETGAGKSILIDAIHLLCGERVDKGLIRSGSNSCEVTGLFLISSKIIEEIHALFSTCGVHIPSSEEICITRKICSGGTRNFINGQLISSQILRELGTLLLDIHGPYENQSLLSPRTQLCLLDRAGDWKHLLCNYTTLFESWKQAQEEFDMVQKSLPSEKMIQDLQYQIQELSTNPISTREEEENLETQYHRLQHAQQWLGILQECWQQIRDEKGGILERLRTCRRLLMQLHGWDNHIIEKLVPYIDQSYAQMEAFLEEIRDLLDCVDLDPQSQQQIEQKLSLLNRLKRKYSCQTVDELVIHLSKAKEELHRWEHLESYLESLKKKIDNLYQQMMEVGKEISEVRKNKANCLATKISTKLQTLGFPQAQFKIKVEQGLPQQTGLDQVSFEIAPNPGEGIHPLSDIASSGEIARIMLALKTILAEADLIPTLIFDEVDANVGGVTAKAIGKELKNLTQYHQIICITHDPSIAAMGDAHFRVYKEIIGERTYSKIVKLTHPSERIEEIARMLGSSHPESAAYLHAKELLAIHQNY